MIAESVRRKAKLLVGLWQPIGQAIPQLTLDSTYPSLGIIDLILFSLKAYPPSTNKDEVLSSLAAYTAVIIHNNLSLVGLEIETDDRDGVSLRVKNDVQKELFRIELEQYFKEQLNSTDISVSAQLTSLMTGAPSIGEGVWRQGRDEETDSRQFSLVHTLIPQIVRSLGETLPQLTKEDLNGLFPPLTLFALTAGVRNEQWIKSTKDFSKAAIAKLSDGSDLTEFAFELSRMANFELGCVGLVILGAIQEELPSPRIIRALAAANFSRGELFVAIAALRGELRAKKDWVEIKETIEEEEFNRLRLDYSLGFVPSRSFEELNFSRKEIRLFLFLLASGNDEAALEVLNKELEIVNVGDALPIIFEAAFLQLKLGRLSELQVAINILSQFSTRFNARHQALFCELAAKNQLLAGNTQQAALLFKKGLEKSSEISENMVGLLSCLNALNRPEEVLSQFAQYKAKKKLQTIVAVDLEYLKALAATGKIEDAKQEGLLLLSEFPGSRWIFPSVISYVLSMVGETMSVH